MKKLFLGLLAAMLMAAGLVASVGSSPAQAACPYTGCFETKTGLTVNPAGNGPRVRTFTATVRPVGTDQIPDGVFVFRFKRVGGGAQFATRTIKQSTTITLTRKFAPGKYNVRVTFVAEDNSPFKDSRSTNRQFTVKRG